MSTPNPSPVDLTRRGFVTHTALTGAGIFLSGSASSRAAAPDSGRKARYAVVGVGGRSLMYREAILKNYAAHCELVGFCDINPGRLKLAQAKARDLAGGDIPIFEANDFDRMVSETKPDVVIVTTKDATHSQYIIRAMELGCDVVTEKPMTTDEEKCRAILDAQPAR